MKRTKRRHNAGFGYIGSGNNHSVFNRKPKKVFSKLKEELNTESQTHFQLNFKDEELSNSEKQFIKDKIRSYEKSKMIKSIIISSIGIIILIFVAKYMIEGVLFRH